MASSGSYTTDRLIPIGSKFEASPSTAWNCELETSAETGTGISNIRLKPELQKVQVRRSLNILFSEHHFTWTPAEEHGCNNKLKLCLFN
ncbi:hypothetical protein AVEN_216238-1 [Araneus ventricosus]|uniref:Uncharacterized protein n=1 Tax=Araneus ventricosus TaxID=182803 RepID=A0A4Y2TV12_ARAVE|nr:hypothetical protein AVEN_216238-1 [Araneus ventricosus]